MKSIDSNNGTAGASNENRLVGIVGSRLNKMREAGGSAGSVEAAAGRLRGAGDVLSPEALMAWMKDRGDGAGGSQGRGGGALSATGTDGILRDVVQREMLTQDMLTKEQTAAAEASARDAVAGAGGTLVALAGTKEGRARLIAALTGMREADLSPAQKKAVGAFLAALSKKGLGGIDARSARSVPAGSIAAGTVEGDALPEGVRGAATRDASGRDVVLLAKDLSGEALEGVAREEVGEVLAARAKAAGVDVAGGDAGARIVRAMAGETVTAKGDASAFAARPGDTATVVVGGEAVEGRALMRIATSISPGKYSKEFLDAMREVEKNWNRNGSARDYGKDEGGPAFTGRVARGGLAGGDGVVSISDIDTVARTGRYPDGKGKPSAKTVDAAKLISQKYRADWRRLSGKNQGSSGRDDKISAGEMSNVLRIIRSNLVPDKTVPPSPPPPADEPDDPVADIVVTTPVAPLTVNEREKDWDERRTIKSLGALVTSATLERRSGGAVEARRQRILRKAMSILGNNGFDPKAFESGSLTPLELLAATHAVAAALQDEPVPPKGSLVFVERIRKRARNNPTVKQFVRRSNSDPFTRTTVGPYTAKTTKGISPKKENNVGDVQRLAIALGDYEVRFGGGINTPVAETTLIASRSRYARYRKANPPKKPSAGRGAGAAGAAAGIAGAAGAAAGAASAAAGGAGAAAAGGGGAAAAGGAGGGSGGVAKPPAKPTRPVGPVPRAPIPRGIGPSPITEKRRTDKWTGPGTRNLDKLVDAATIDNTRPAARVKARRESVERRAIEILAKEGFDPANFKGDGKARALSPVETLAASHAVAAALLESRGQFGPAPAKAIDFLDQVNTNAKQNGVFRGIVTTVRALTTPRDRTFLTNPFNFYMERSKDGITGNAKDNAADLGRLGNVLARYQAVTGNDTPVAPAALDSARLLYRSTAPARSEDTSAAGGDGTPPGQLTGDQINTLLRNNATAAFNADPYADEQVNVNGKWLTVRTNKVAGKDTMTVYAAVPGRPDTRQMYTIARVRMNGENSFEYRMVDRQGNVNDIAFVPPARGNLWTIAPPRLKAGAGGRAAQRLFRVVPLVTRRLTIGGQQGTPFGPATTELPTPPGLAQVPVRLRDPNAGPRRVTPSDMLRDAAAVRAFTDGRVANPQILLPPAQTQREYVYGLVAQMRGDGGRAEGLARNVMARIDMLARGPLSPGAQPMEHLRRLNDQGAQRVFSTLFRRMGTAVEALEDLGNGPNADAQTLELVTTITDTLALARVWNAYVGNNPNVDLSNPAEFRAAQATVQRNFEALISVSPSAPSRYVESLVLGLQAPGQVFATEGFGPMIQQPNQADYGGMFFTMLGQGANADVNSPTYFAAIPARVAARRMMAEVAAGNDRRNVVIDNIENGVPPLAGGDAPPPRYQVYERVFGLNAVPNVAAQDSFVERAVRDGMLPTDGIIFFGGGEGRAGPPTGRPRVIIRLVTGDTYPPGAYDANYTAGQSDQLVVDLNAARLKLVGKPRKEGNDTIITVRPA